MMTEKKITLTKESIEALKTGSGGYSRVVLNMMGIQWPPKKGWKTQAIGKEVPLPGVF